MPHLRVAIASAALLTAVWSQHTRASGLSDVVDRASRYVASLGDELVEVVAEERYRQSWHTPGSEPVERVLRSEFVVVGTADRAEWVGFRDVFVVDGGAFTTERTGCASSSCSATLGC